MTRPFAHIAGTGRGLPVRVVTNNDFAALGIETSDEWIVERTGIRERRVCGPGESTCSRAADASRGAMHRAGVQPGELDTIILSTATPDRLRPATAVDLQAALGASRAAAFDLSAACSGWIYGMTVAEGMIATGTAETVLVAGSEKMSAIVDWSDRATCVLFGDGAGAVVLRKNDAHDRAGILSSFMRSDGALADLLYRPPRGGATPTSTTVAEDRGHPVKTAKQEAFQ
ncbi:MAG: 3-oxoacyl-ACP synthase, partial [Gemmatimonadaceae bacterium]